MVNKSGITKFRKLSMFVLHSFHYSGMYPFITRLWQLCDVNFYQMVCHGWGLSNRRDTFIRQTIRRFFNAIANEIDPVTYILTKPTVQLRPISSCPVTFLTETYAIGTYEVMHEIALYDISFTPYPLPL